MSSARPPRSRVPSRLAAGLAALALLLAAAAPASASPETLTRATTNMLFGPLDFALGPVVGARSIYNNLQYIDDTTGVRIFYVIPAVPWNAMMCMSGAVARTLAGMFEFVPGLILLPFEADMDPIFAPVDKSDALIDAEVGFVPVRIGINYVN